MKIQIEFDELRSICMKNYNGQCEFHRRDIHRCEVALCPVIEKEVDIKKCPIYEDDGVSDNEFV
jgi:hypothetical protein